MGRAYTPELMFATPEAAEFRARTLAGCCILDVEELRALADEIHACARERRAPDAYFSAYSARRGDDEHEGPIFDRRL